MQLKAVFTHRKVRVSEPCVTHTLLTGVVKDLLKSWDQTYELFSSCDQTKLYFSSIIVFRLTHMSKHSLPGTACSLAKSTGTTAVLSTQWKTGPVKPGNSHSEWSSECRQCLVISHNWQHRHFSDILAGTRKKPVHGQTAHLCLQAHLEVCSFR